MFLIDPIRKFYGRFERPISSLSLIGGFVFDAITLQRVDTLWENIWVFAHLLIVATFIYLIHIHEAGEGDENNPEKAHFWYVNILQFFFGGILSTYLVFYFRSADILVTWPFILILAIAFIANESLKRHYMRLSFQLSLFFLSVYSFAIFLVPVLIHQIGTKIFLLSGLFSLVFISIYISLLFFLIRRKSNLKKKLVFYLIAGILALVNILYFTNLIPPIPLSLKDAGVYHSIRKNYDGNYAVQYEDLGFASYFQLYQNFKETPSSKVYAFSAVFSPSSLNITVIHEWQHYNEAIKKWIVENIVRLPVTGGRGDGFRTYSFGTNLDAGKWRVNIKTLQGQTIGRLRFNIVMVDTEPQLSTDVK